MSRDEERIRELHEGWVKANGNGDLNWLRAHLAGDDFVMWNTMGSNFFGVDGIVALWKRLIEMTGEAKPQKVVSESWDERIMVGADMAAVSYLCRLKIDFGPHGDEAGGRLDQQYRATEIYHRRDGDWKMIHYHGSPHLPGVMGGS